jgi:hypothetical protein
MSRAGRMLTVGLIEFSGGQLSLTAPPDAMTTRASAPPAVASPPPAAKARPLAPTAPSPRASEGAKRRKVRWQFNHDRAGFADAKASDPGMTLDAWVARNGWRCPDDVGERVGERPGNGSENALGTGGERVENGSENALPSHTLPSEKEREIQKQQPGARATGTGGERPENAPENAPVHVRCPTVERTVTAPSAAEVLMRLRGDGKLRLSVSTTHEAELERALSSVSPVWTLAGVERLARHVGAGHLRDGWRPRLDDLRGKDGTWSRLLTLHDEAQDCARCRRRGDPDGSRPSPGLTDPTPAPVAFISDEERKAAARAVMERRKAREKAEAAAAAEAARQRMATAEVTHG